MKCLVSFLLLSLALFSVNAYEFDDSAFNEYLFRELQSLQDDDTADDLLTHRTRRDADGDSSEEKDAKHCSKHGYMNMYCCKGNHFSDDLLDRYKEVKKECVGALKGEHADIAYDPFDCDKMKQVKEQIICVSECIAKKHNNFDDNGQFKRDVILEQMRSQIDVQWKKDAMEGYVDKCLAEVKERHEQLEKEGKLSEGCSRYPLAFHRCLWRELWNGCPAELHVNTPRCNKLRELVTQKETHFFGQNFLYKYFPNSGE